MNRQNSCSQTQHFNCYTHASLIDCFWTHFKSYHRKQYGSRCHMNNCWLLIGQTTQSITGPFSCWSKWKIFLGFSVWNFNDLGPYWSFILDGLYKRGWECEIFLGENIWSLLSTGWCPFLPFCEGLPLVPKIKNYKYMTFFYQQEHVWFYWE